jgi:hypothetical protein
MNKRGSLVIIIEVLVIIMLLAIVGLVVYYVTGSSEDSGIGEAAVAVGTEEGSGTIVADSGNNQDDDEVQRRLDEYNQKLADEKKAEDDAEAARLLEEYNRGLADKAQDAERNVVESEKPAVHFFRFKADDDRRMNVTMDIFFEEGYTDVEFLYAEGEDSFHPNDGSSDSAKFVISTSNVLNYAGNDPNPTFIATKDSKSYVLKAEVKQDGTDLVTIKKRIKNSWSTVCENLEETEECDIDGLMLTIGIIDFSSGEFDSIQISAESGVSFNKVYDKFEYYFTIPTINQDVDKVTFNVYDWDGEVNDDPIFERIYSVVSISYIVNRNN